MDRSIRWEKAGCLGFRCAESVLLVVVSARGVGAGAHADSGNDLADELLEAAFASFDLHFGLTNCLFPCWGEAGCLFTHHADCALGDLILPVLGTAGLVLQAGQGDTEVFVLPPELIKFILEGSIPLGVDLELSVEVPLEFAQFAFQAAHITGQTQFGGESRLPCEEGEGESDKESPNELILHDFDELFHGISVRYLKRFRWWYDQELTELLKSDRAGSWRRE